MLNNPNTDAVADAVLGALRDILAKQSGDPSTRDDDTLLETIKDVLVKNLPGGAGSTQSSYPGGGLPIPRRETATANHEDEWSEMLARHAEERQEMKLRHEREREEVRGRREEARLEREQQREDARLERERQMEARRQEREAQMEARRRERETRQRPS